MNTFTKNPLITMNDFDYLRQIEEELDIYLEQLDWSA